MIPAVVNDLPRSQSSQSTRLFSDVHEDPRVAAAIHHGERQTTYCPTCQADGRVYADRRLSRLLR